MIIIKHLDASCLITTANFEFKAIEGDGQFAKCKTVFKTVQSLAHEGGFQSPGIV